MGLLLAQTRPSVSAFPETTIGSACTSTFSRIARRLLTLRPAHSRGHQNRDRYPKASDISSPPCLLRLLPAGAVAGACTRWKSAALSRRTWHRGLFRHAGAGADAARLPRGRRNGGRFSRRLPIGIARAGHRFPGTSEGATDRSCLVTGVSHATSPLFVTVDRNLSFQQNIASFPIAVVVLRARTNRLADLKLLVSSLLAAIASTPPGRADRRSPFCSRLGRHQRKGTGTCSRCLRMPSASGQEHRTKR